MKNLFVMGSLLVLGAINSPAFAQSSAEIEKAFYQAIARADVDGAMDLMHASLRDVIDRPVFEAWALKVQENLGDYITTQQVSRQRTFTLLGMRVDTESELTFSRGPAKCTTGVLNKKVISFSLQSDLMRDWFQGPSDIGLYAEQADEFVRAFLAEDLQKTESLMHAALRKALPSGDLQAMMVGVAGNAGPLKSLKQTSQRFSLEGENPALILGYEVECERARGRCEIEFQFAGMKGHLVAFQFQ